MKPLCEEMLDHYRHELNRLGMSVVESSIEGGRSMNIDQETMSYTVSVTHDAISGGVQVSFGAGSLEELMQS